MIRVSEATESAGSGFQRFEDGEKLIVSNGNKDIALYMFRWNAMIVNCMCGTICDIVGVLLYKHDHLLY